MKKINTLLYQGIGFDSYSENLNIAYESINKWDFVLSNILANIGNTLQQSTSRLVAVNNKFVEIESNIKEVEKTIKKNLSELDNYFVSNVDLIDSDLTHPIDSADSSIGECLQTFYHNLATDNEYCIPLKDIQYAYLKSQFDKALIKVSNLKNKWKSVKKYYLKLRYKNFVLNIRSSFRRIIHYSLKNLDDVSGDREIVNSLRHLIHLQLLNLNHNEEKRKETNYRLIT